MSYGIKITCVGGELTAASSVNGAPVPDGTWVISGHWDELARQVGVAQLDDAGGMLLHSYTSCRPFGAPPAEPEGPEAEWDPPIAAGSAPTEEEDTSGGDTSAA